MASASMAMDAHRWLIDHPKEASEYQGRWVAVSGTGIELAAGSLSEIIKEKGAKNFLITKIPLLKEIEEVLY
ncbi:hypothetical protein COT29_01050 [Candidatus Micrarchaeota archaeon CG08_land_8_20_14_0_20_59_11]|nr:MAG: hypothetical protein COT29_01050 [Candidatus Micrarchaeota archaeon CG08_land_8_20_14_0_20_59_11]